MSDPLTDPANWTGSHSPTPESPPQCYNVVDADGFFWFSSDVDLGDLSVKYSGPPIGNDEGTEFGSLWHYEWKMVGGDGGSLVTWNLNAFGNGNISGIETLGASGSGAIDTFYDSDPTDDFSISTFSAAPNSIPSGVSWGIKFAVSFAPPAPPPPPGGTVIPTAFPEFPECPTYGFNSQPQYLVNINTRDGGFERVDARWTRPLNVYTAVPLGDRDEADIQSILYFWHAMGGRSSTFIIKDWTDYKSCPVQDDVGLLDQPLQPVTLVDSSTAYQLVKEYAVGSFTQVREITQPIGTTIVVANESGVEQDDYTLDESSGLLKPGPSFTGTPQSWGGEFNVAVRFDSELAMQVVDQQIQTVSFTLCEKRIALANTFPGSG